jgi:uncharacterized protein YkwD
MHRLTLLLLLLVLAGCDRMGAAVVNRILGPSTPESTDGTPEAFRHLATSVNDFRRSVGCGSLIWHPGAAQVAQQHAEDMAGRGYFGHTSPEGLSPFDRLARVGIRFRAAGENIAQGQPTIEIVTTTWSTSTLHRANWSTCSFTHHGSGGSQGSWTHIMLAPR